MVGGERIEMRVRGEDKIVEEEEKWQGNIVRPVMGVRREGGREGGVGG